MTACPGWMAAVLIGDKDFSPETGGFTLGDEPNIETYNAVGFSSARRALINSETSMTLDSFRYGEAAEELITYSNDASNVDVVILLGGFDKDGDPWTANNHPYGFVPTEMKVGEVVASGVSVTAPYDGVVAATAETPQGDRWYESVVPSTGKAPSANTSPVLFVDANDTNTTKVHQLTLTGGKKGDRVVLAVLEVKGSGVTATAVGTSISSSVALEALANDSNGFKLYELGTLSKDADASTTVTFNSSSSKTVVGYLAAVKALG